jgi:hypothetical protein
MVAPQRLVEQSDARASGLHPAIAGPKANALAADANAIAITPPWHIRHARVLIAAVAALLTVGFGYLSYQVWRIQNDPVDRILAARGQPPALPQADSLTAVPAVAPAPPRVVIPAPAAVAAPPRQQPRASPASSAAVRPAVTHTQRDDAGGARLNAAAPLAAVGIDKQASSQASQSCSEGVVALGLCVPVTTAGK